MPDASTVPITLAAAGGDRIVFDLLVILAIAGVIALVMQRVRLAVVPAYLIAGVLVGPNALGFVASEERLAEVAHLAIILLMFGIGLEMDIAVLRRGLGRMIVAGIGSCAVCVAAGWPLAALFGLGAPAALAVAMALSLSSTAVVLRIVSARRELRRRSGRLSFAILVIQDVAALGMLAVLPAIAGWSGAAGAGAGTEPVSGARDFMFEALVRVGGVAGLVVVAKAALPLILRESLRAGRLEVMLLVGLAAALAAAAGAHFIGFSEEMGAFLAGFILSGTPFRHQMSAQVGPLRDIFSALFFTTVGMKVDPQLVADGWWVIGLAVLLVVAVKALLIGGLCWGLGAMASTSIVVGLYLAQAGEFSLVLLREAGDLGILGERVVAHTIALVVISLVITPALAELGRRLARASPGLGTAPWVAAPLLDELPGGAQAPRPDPRHIIVGGFGPVGRRVAEELERAGLSFTIVELNPDTVREQLRRHRSIVFGDVSNLHVLESAGIGRADALILTIPDEEAVLRACAVARRRAPGVFIAARTGLFIRSEAAARSGADAIVIEEMATAEAMLRIVSQRIGTEAGKPPADERVEPLAASPAPPEEPVEIRA